MAVIDTNIIIDYLNGYHEAKRFLAQVQNPVISVITWSELLVGCKTKQQKLITSHYVRQNYTIIPVDEDIGSMAAEIRQEQAMKLPDALILATTLHKDTYLVTRNTKDFNASLPNIRIPYSLN